MANEIPRWSDNTREERFFTAILFQALLTDATPLLNLLRPCLGLPMEVTVTDVGYEVCMLRDLAHDNLIRRDSRVRALEKQTFDLVLTLSNDSLVLIEAKAHQGFSIVQCQNMLLAAEILLANSDLGIRRIYTAGIHSSNYKPINIRSQFKAMALTTWEMLATAYPGIASRFYGENEATHPFRRANQIYGN